MRLQAPRHLIGGLAEPQIAVIEQIIPLPEIEDRHNLALLPAVVTAYTYTAVLREVLFDVVYLKNISLLYAENGRFFAFQHPKRRFAPIFPAVRPVIRHAQADVVGDDFRLTGRNRRPECRLCRSGRRRRQKEKRKKNLFHNTIH